MSAGIFMLSGGFIAASFASRVWHVYLSQGVLVGVGVGALFIPSVQVLPQWFLRRRSLAGGIASAGSGFVGLAFSLGTDAMIRQISLAWALRITGLIALVANAIGTALIRDRNALVKPPQLGFAVHLLRRYDCLLLLSWAFVNLLGYMVILYSLSSYAVQVAGLTQAQAGILTAVLNLGTGVGRPMIGFASDRFGRIQVAAVLTLACAILVFAVWIPATSYGVLIVFALFSGAILGTFWMVSHCQHVTSTSSLTSHVDRRSVVRRSRWVERGSLFPLAAMANDRATNHVCGGHRLISAPSRLGALGIYLHADICGPGISHRLVLPL